MIKTQPYTFLQRRRLDITCWLLSLAELIDPTTVRKGGV